MDKETELELMRLEHNQVIYTQDIFLRLAQLENTLTGIVAKCTEIETILTELEKTYASHIHAYWAGGYYSTNLATIPTNLHRPDGTGSTGHQ